jgi:MoxR-like ATPase
MSSIVEAKAKIKNLAQGLSDIFVGRRELIRIMITATVAQEPILFVGPPGTAKSLLVNSFCHSIGMGENDYFEYLLTRYSEPSEILGPVDLEKLKEGTYMRRTTGQLPEAQVAFLDEIFKANSAILNILLTLINERKFYQDGKPVEVPLRMLFAASNEIPVFGEFEALKDRFILKVETRPVQKDHFWELIQVGFSLESKGEYFQRLQSLKAIGTVIEDFDVLNGYLQDTLLVRAATENGNPFGNEQVSRMFHSLIAMIQEEEKVKITDRKIIKLAKLVLADALIFGENEKPSPKNLQVLAYAGNDFAEIRRLELQVKERLSMTGTMP